jgi:hypothetical protein
MASTTSMQKQDTDKEKKRDKEDAKYFTSK